MSFMKLLGLSAENSGDSRDSGSMSVREIADRLSHLDPPRANWIAAFAMVLARAARADLEISRSELESMREIVGDVGGLTEEEAQLVVEMAAHRNQLRGVSEDYLAAREFRRLAADGDNERLLGCLFAVTAADDSISLVEEEELRQVANELGIEHAEFTRIRSRFREKREVMRTFLRAGGQQSVDSDGS
jgi:uncharacterized tellurite resistance protein B-like protein